MNNQFPAYAPVKIAEKFWSIEQGGVRCYLFEGDETALLIDAGFGGDLKSVCETLTDKPIQLLITHADGDHIGAAEQFGSFYMHTAEESYYRQRHSKNPDYITLERGFVMDIGSFRFEIIHIPGHTPGSIALLERKKRFIITGDTVGNVPIYMFGSGRDIDAYLETVKKLSAMADSFDLIYPSHGTLPQEPEILHNLIALATDVVSGNPPQPTDAPAHLPPSVKVYSGYGVSFLLQL